MEDDKLLMIKSFPHVSSYSNYMDLQFSKHLAFEACINDKWREKFSHFRNESCPSINFYNSCDYIFTKRSFTSEKITHQKKLFTVTVVCRIDLNSIVFLFRPFDVGQILLRLKILRSENIFAIMFVCIKNIQSTRH